MRNCCHGDAILVNLGVIFVNGLRYINIDSSNQDAWVDVRLIWTYVGLLFTLIFFGKVTIAILYW